MKILHVVPGLLHGGAETILSKLVTDAKIGGHSHYVVCLGDSQSELANQLVHAGVAVTSLGVLPQRPLTVARLLRLRGEIKRFEPDLIQTWMYHANLFGGLVARVSGAAPVLWSLRQDVSDRSTMKPLTRIFVWLGALFSFFVPARIASVSERAVLSHSALGYRRDKFIVIANGIDTGRFAPRPGAAAQLRKGLGLRPETVLIGFVARYHPMKGHSYFLAAAEILHRSHPDVHFMFCGQGMDSNNADLSYEIGRRGLRDVVHLLGHRGDIQDLLPGLDIYSISSLSEGFPLSVGEAMASSLPCVVTDVGDSARLVGGTGLVVPPADPAALEAAWRNLLNRPHSEREVMGAAARQRIVENFGLERMLSEYNRLYLSIAGAVGSTGEF